MMETVKRTKRSVKIKQVKEELKNVPIVSATATARYLRLSPMKARPVVNSIRGMDVNSALATLTFTPNKAARYVKKLLKSAIANAQNNFDLDTDSLYISECYVNDGPRYKRLEPKSMGRAAIRLVRFCHITIEVTDRSREMEQNRKEVK